MGFDEASLLPKPGQFVKLSGRGLDSREIKNVLHSGFSTYPFHLTSPFFHKVRVVFFFMNSSTRCEEELDRSFKQPQEHPGNRDEISDEYAKAGLLC